MREATDADASVASLIPSKTFPNELARGFHGDIDRAEAVIAIRAEGV